MLASGGPGRRVQSDSMMPQENLSDWQPFPSCPVDRQDNQSDRGEGLILDTCHGSGQNS